jgi:hypothetical protein
MGFACGPVSGVPLRRRKCTFETKPFFSMCFSLAFPLGQPTARESLLVGPRSFGLALSPLQLGAAFPPSGRLKNGASCAFTAPSPMSGSRANPAARHLAESRTPSSGEASAAPHGYSVGNARHAHAGAPPHSHVANTEPAGDIAYAVGFGKNLGCAAFYSV